MFRTSKPIKPSIETFDQDIETEILRLMDKQSITISTELTNLIYRKRDYEIEQLRFALGKTEKAGSDPSQLRSELNPITERLCYDYYYDYMRSVSYLKQFTKFQIEQSADALVEYLEKEKSALINSHAKEISHNYLDALDRLYALDFSHATIRLEIAKQESSYGFFNSPRKTKESSGLRAGQEICGILVPFDMDPDPNYDELNVS